MRFDPLRDKQPGADTISIVVRAAEGDDTAYEELVRRFQPFIRNLLQRLCRNRETADDLAQQAFLKAWRRISFLREPAAFAGWLRSIAVSEWLQLVRRKHIETQDMNESPTDIHARCAGNDRKIDLDGALSRLSPGERLCIVLAYSQGMSHTEIADVTTWPLGTVKSHIVRGSARLREILSSYR